MSDLQKSLKEMGFLMVTGTTETIRGEVSRIPFSSVCNSWDYNNGIYAVADEYGAIWICPVIVLASFDIFQIEETFSVLGVTNNALYVPHSNDGGIAVSQIWPKNFKAPTRACL